MNVGTSKIRPVARLKRMRRTYRRLAIMVKNDVRALLLSVDG